MNPGLFLLIVIITPLISSLEIVCRTNNFSDCFYREDKCFVITDSSKISNIVYKENIGFTAIDKNGNELFQIFPFENGPDYISEGLFRIVENGRIGYADESGKIVIKPRFEFALPFNDGLAAFCEGCAQVRKDENISFKDGRWGFIDKSGTIVIPAKFDKIINQFDKGIATVEYSGETFLINKNGYKLKMDNVKYQKWIELLGLTAKLTSELFFGSDIKVELNWLNNDSFVFNSKENLEYLRISIIKDDEFEVLRYNVIPWQNFSVSSASEFLISLEELCTINDFTVIYNKFNPREKHKDDIKFIEEFNNHFMSVLEKEIYNTPVEEEVIVPENVQLISGKIFPHYVDLQIALPGSVLPDDSTWMSLYKDKMIYLQLVPDFGAVKKRWIKTQDLPTDTYYTSVEEELLECFDEALHNAFNFPSNRKVIFKEALLKMRGLFSAANSYVNFLYQKYERRLGAWLFVDNINEEIFAEPEGFGDYQPKLTEDCLTDYMPSLLEEIENLPAARLENFAELFRLLKQYQEKAKVNTGHWEDGNMVLGAQPREYIPSEDELLASETGDRLASIISSNNIADIISGNKNINLSSTGIEYKKFTFTHCDVMGSGRFFYVLDMKVVPLVLKKSEE